MIEELVFNELKALRAYEKEERVSIDSHVTRGGAFVPFIIRGRGFEVTALALDEGESMSEKSLKGLYSFSKRYPDAKLLHTHSGDAYAIHKGRVLSFPVAWLF